LILCPELPSLLCISIGPVVDSHVDVLCPNLSIAVFLASAVLVHCKLL
jgi:hypothetical protein